MDLSKLQNGSDVRGVALAGVENEPVTLDDAAVRAIAGGKKIQLHKHYSNGCRNALQETICRVL